MKRISWKRWLAGVLTAIMLVQMFLLASLAEKQPTIASAITEPIEIPSQPINTPVNDATLVDSVSDALIVSTKISSYK